MDGKAKKDTVRVKEVSVKTPQSDLDAVARYNNKFKRFTCRLAPADYDRLLDACSMLDISINKLVGGLILEYLDKLDF